MPQYQIGKLSRGAPPARAVVFERPGELSLRSIELPVPADGEVMVDVEWSGISTGTERLLWTGRMPSFPGMGYPLVPGYETVGRVVTPGDDDSLATGQRVFVSGARCYGEIRGLFGGASSRLVVEASKVTPLGEDLAEEGVMLALAATAYHALHHEDRPALPDLIVGHGALGRLLARLTFALGGVPPVVWETQSSRKTGARGYPVVSPDDDQRRDYRRIVDASGDPGLLDELIQRLNRGGEVVLAGFYAEPLSFAFPPAFMREACIRVAAEWSPSDLAAVSALAVEGRLDLSDLITHRAVVPDARDAYERAFTDPECLKMILDWRNL